MELKNRNIAEGMFVINGKQTWRVIFWDKKYQNALLQFIDEKENRTRNYVIAEGYTLDGTEKEAYISWINGLYFDARSEEDAFIEFEKWLNGDSMKESKKVKSTSIKESAKPINEKNVAKFVDELNVWVDDNVNFADVESAQFTRKYGKLYDFKYGWDYSYGDKGLLKVWDDEGTLDWFEESYVKDFIVNLAKKYGWYCECVTSDSDFTFDEI